MRLVFLRNIASSILQRPKKTAWSRASSPNRFSRRIILSKTVTRRVTRSKDECDLTRATDGGRDLLLPNATDQARICR